MVYILNTTIFYDLSFHLVLASAGALLLMFTVASCQTTTSIPRSVPTHSPASCSELAGYSNTYQNCDTYSNCSGTLCHLAQQLRGSRATFWVEEKCADPVMVDLNVDGPENSHLNGYRGRFRVGGDGLQTREPNSITANYGRNASHLTFRVGHVVFTCQRDVISCTCVTHGVGVLYRTHIITLEYYGAHVHVLHIYI